MQTLNPGDLVTFPLRSDKYGLAQLVHVDELPTSVLYHFAILDAVVDATGGGVDQFGDPLPREHDLGAIGSASAVVDHVGLTRHGLDASDMVVVGASEVGDDELRGYRMWLHMRYQDAVRRGVIRERIDDNEYDVVESGLDDDDTDGDERDESSRSDADREATITDELDAEPGEADGASLAEAELGAADEAALSEAEASTGYEAGSESEGEEDGDDGSTATTSLGIYDVALGDALIRQRSIFEREPLRDTTLGRFVASMADDTAAIEELIARLIDGDFGAGDELLDYGEAAVAALGRQLDPYVEPQTADDILQVLVNSGEEAAYDRVASFMVEHGGDPADPLYSSAVRAYCYAVMLTAGEPEPLKRQLAMLESVKDPELAGDVRAAHEAIAGRG